MLGPLRGHLGPFGGPPGAYFRSVSALGGLKRGPKPSRRAQGRAQGQKKSTPRGVLDALGKSSDEILAEKVLQEVSNRPPREAPKRFQTRRGEECKFSFPCRRERDFGVPMGGPMRLQMGSKSHLKLRSRWNFRKIGSGSAPRQLGGRTKSSLKQIWEHLGRI